MKLKAMLRWYLENSAITVSVMTGIVILMWLVRIVLYFTMDGAVVINGLEFSIFVTMFVAGIVLFASGFRFGCINGASRRTVFKGFLCNALVVNGAMAAVYTLLLFVDGLIFRGGDDTSVVYWLTRDLFGLEDTLLAIPLYFLITFVFYLSATLLGYPIAGVFYRLSRVGRVLWAAGLPISLTVILPTLVALLPEGIQSWLSAALESLINFLIRSPLNLLLFGTVICLLGAVGGWLLLRRAPLKAAS